MAIRKPQRVTLEVVTDDLSGLTLNFYRWREGCELKMECEMGNRLIGNALPLRALPYDQSDRDRAEARRAALENALDLRNAGK